MSTRHLRVGRYKDVRRRRLIKTIIYCANYRIVETVALAPVCKSAHV